MSPEINAPPIPTDPSRLSRALEATGSLLNSIVDRIPNPSWKNVAHLAMAGVAVVTPNVVGGESPAEAAEPDAVLAEICPPDGQVNGNYGANVASVRQGVSVMADLKFYDRNNTLFREASMTIASNRNSGNPVPFTQPVPNASNINPEDGKVTMVINRAWNESDFSPASHNPEPQEIKVDCLNAPVTTTTQAEATTTTTTIAEVTSSVPVTTIRATTTSSRPAIVPVPAAPTTPSTEATTTTAASSSTTVATSPVTLVSAAKNPDVKSSSRTAVIAAKHATLHGEKADNKNRGNRLGVALILAGTIAVMGAAGQVLRRKFTSTGSPKPPYKPRPANP